MEILLYFSQKVIIKQMGGMDHKAHLTSYGSSGADLLRRDFVLCSLDCKAG